MALPKQYLKSNVLCEPLFNSWYVWTQLISPHTASQHMMNFHLPVMESFIDSPELHVEAIRNPAMLGGPFIDLDPARVPAIEQLLDHTTSALGDYLALGEAIREANRLVDANALGFSAESLYRELPELLRGRVEIVYDDENHPSLRFIESLLYGPGGVYDERHQSVLLSTVVSDDRGFILTTPRLEDERHVGLPVPFRSPLIDRLFGARTEPVAAEELADDFGLAGAKRARFLDFFTPAPPAGNATQVQGDGVRIRYFGHACVLVQSADVSILIDPTMSYRYDGVGTGDRFTIEDLPPHLDYVLLTHDHQDHICLEFLLQLRQRIGTLVVPRAASGTLLNPSVKRILNAAGFAQVVELDELESIGAGSHCITGLPFFGEHGDLAIAAKLGYHVRVGARSVLFLADSKNLDTELYRRLHARLGDVDVIFIGMECDGAPVSFIYGPLMRRPLPRRMDQTRRLSGSNSKEALEIASVFRCRQAYVYAMGQEPWLVFLTTIQYTDESTPIVESNRFVAACRDAGIEAERLYVKKEIVL